MRALKMDLLEALRRNYLTDEGRVPHEPHDYMHEFGSIRGLCCIARCSIQRL
jgi:hypothetical protein